MKYLLDTCVISELIQSRPAPGVVSWVNAQLEDHLFLSVITMGELRKGVDLLPAGAKRRRLHTWLDSDLEVRFSDRWLPISLDVAGCWGVILARAQTTGKTVPAIDGLIAATAIAHGCTLVTRNTRDMIHTGVSLLNPWEG